MKDVLRNHQGKAGYPHPQRAAWRTIVALMVFLGPSMMLFAQQRPYIGYTYPAGGQQGTTFQIKLGGQGLDEVADVLVTGSGVTARIVEYYRRLNPQEMQLLNEQVRELKKTRPPTESAPAQPLSAEELIGRIERRSREYVQTPACASLSALVFAEVAIAPDAEPGVRELRLATPRGVSNPLIFHVGPLPEHTRKPMITASIQVLGKEAAALRKRPPEESEERITIPCTVNGQIASGEVNRYRFTARAGQRLVVSTQARQLMPFIADAVPGWFQPVLSVQDAKGKEVAFADDYRFKPDPVVLFEVPKDGEYVFGISDAIYRGREDFVYRISIGELPFATSIFPLGAKAGAKASPKLQGWNLQGTTLELPQKDASPGIRWLTGTRKEVLNPVPFALDVLPEVFEREPNDSPSRAHLISLPVMINGRIGKPGDSDVFRFRAKSNDTIVAEVWARRLDSPLDSIIKLTGEDGNVIAWSDDRDDLSAGANTHHADSWLMTTLPADGVYYVQIGDTARHGGEEYGYRLRISPPQPDFELRVVPSSISLRPNSIANLTVYAQRKDGLTNAIKLELKNPPPGISGEPAQLSSDQTSARFVIRSSRMPTKGAVNLSVVGMAAVAGTRIVHEALPAEDRMQAFLWRQLVPALELKALVFDPSYEAPVKRPVPHRPPSDVVATTNSIAGPSAAKLKFNKTQIARRLREINLLYEEGLLTDAFYNQKVDECEALQ